MRPKKRMPSVEYVKMIAEMKFPKLKSMVLIAQYIEHDREKYVFSKRKGVIPGSAVFTYYFDTQEIELHDQTYANDDPLT